MAHLLFVDDDPNILKINHRYFESRGYCVTTCENADQALYYVKELSIDCVILDIRMPGIDGLELCRRMKTLLDSPIIFLTCLTEKEYLYQGFSLGGDDFLTKPYDLRELEIRVNTRMKQYAVKELSKKQLEFPPLVIDCNSQRALIDGFPVALTSYEFDILCLLARSPGQVFAPDVIYREVWKLPDLANTQTVKVHVARMRHKLESVCPGRTFISTSWKQGYRFLPE